jgi:hypothetical protein
MPATSGRGLRCWRAGGWRGRGGGTQRELEMRSVTSDSGHHSGPTTAMTPPCTSKRCVSRQMGLGRTSTSGGFRRGGQRALPPDESPRWADEICSRGLAPKFLQPGGPRSLPVRQQLLIYDLNLCLEGCGPSLHGGVPSAKVHLITHHLVMLIGGGRAVAEFGARRGGGGMARACSRRRAVWAV